jgi:hypothetical protein
VHLRQAWLRASLELAAVASSAALFAANAGAQTKKPTPVFHTNETLTRVLPPACCVVTAVDLTHGIMSGRDQTTGYTFKFVVATLSGQDSAKVVRNTTVGQKVWADLVGKGVEVTYGKICCAIIAESDH